MFLNVTVNLNKKTLTKLLQEKQGFNSPQWFYDVIALKWNHYRDALSVFYYLLAYIFFKMVWAIDILVMTQNDPLSKMELTVPLFLKPDLKPVFWVNIIKDVKQTVKK